MLIKRKDRVTPLGVTLVARYAFGSAIEMSFPNVNFSTSHAFSMILIFSRFAMFVPNRHQVRIPLPAIG
jgi:hypothetical protein